MKSAFIRNFIFIYSYLFLIVGTNIYAADTLVISEILAINSELNSDENGDFSDWIEIYNPSTDIININNWSLSDDINNTSKWKFPSKLIVPGAYMLVYASAKNRTDTSKNFHTNFKLLGNGEYLSLYRPDGTPCCVLNPFPSQYQNVSYSFINSSYRYSSNPTPGKANSLDEFLPPPSANVNRGFFNESFTLSLITGVADAEILFTIDGSEPQIANSLKYTSSILINTSTILRAVLYKNGIYSKSATFSYLFFHDIINQSDAPAGYPLLWGPYDGINGYAKADYGMDPEITQNSSYKDLMIPSLRSLPSISLATDIYNLFSPSTHPDTGGIYYYTGVYDKIGAGWDRPVSFEYLNGDKSFQANCELSLRGGASRLPEKSPKHSLNIKFTTDYGPAKLSENIIPGSTAKSFNVLVLRAGYGNSWLHFASDQRKRAQFIRDAWAKNTQLDMGYLSAHNTYVHLYINGLYWGVYNVSEKPDEDFMESYTNGNEPEFDIIKDLTDTISGNFDLWNYVHSYVADSKITNNDYYFKLIGKNSDGSENLSYKSYVDVFNLIDYMILNFYGGNNDWDHHNWVAAINRINPGKGFQFLCWDTEKILEGTSENYVNENNYKAPSGLFRNLLKNNEFKMLVADRANLLLKNNGLLTPELCIERWNKIYNLIDTAMISESARWGDYRRDVHPWSSSPYELYTVNDHMFKAQSNMINNYFPVRSDIVYNQMVSTGLIPSLEAPLIRLETINEDTLKLILTAPKGTIYYSIIGKDPRNIGGTINTNISEYSGPVTIEKNAIIKTRAKSDTIWSPLTEKSVGNTAGLNINNSYAENITLVNNYPNPLNSYTTFTYVLPAKGNVEISIFSLDGRKISTIYKLNQYKGKNYTEWSPEKHIKSGIYIYTIKSGIYKASGKLVIVK